MSILEGPDWDGGPGDAELFQLEDGRFVWRTGGRSFCWSGPLITVTDHATGRAFLVDDEGVAVAHRAEPNLN